MAKTIKNKAKAIFEKIKAVKNIEIIVAVVAIAVLILLYVAFSADKKQTPKASFASENQELSLTNEVEKKLVTVLSSIEGAGKVQVMITYNSSPERIVANTKSTHTNSSNSAGEINNSTNTITETPIIINSKGSSGLYVIKEIMPEIVGVIVVAEGANNIKVRLELMRAVQTILAINANNIEVFAMK